MHENHVCEHHLPIEISVNKPSKLHASIANRYSSTQASHCSKLPEPTDVVCEWRMPEQQLKAARTT